MVNNVLRHYLDSGLNLVDALMQMRDDNHPELRQTLLHLVESPDGQVRVFSALMLAQEFRDVHALPGLHEALSSLDRQGRGDAADAIWEIGDSNPAGLIRALHFERGVVRDSIVEALDLIGWIPDDVSNEVTYLIATRRWKELVPIGADAVPGLVSALADPDGNVRRGAIWALGMIGDDRAVPFLIDMLADTSGDMFDIGVRVCDTAAAALERIGTPQAVEAVATWEAGLA